MALETLKGIEEIGGFKIARSLKEIQANQSNNYFIFITDEQNKIGFQIQNGPIKENGINGCQVDSLIEAATLIIQGLNNKFPCVENTNAIGHLIKAVAWLERRKLNREERGVEGFNKE